MKKAYLFPGQGSQFEGMGRELYENDNQARELFEQANEVLGWRITDVMFQGSKDALTQTEVTQPAVFLESIIRAKIAGSNFQPDAVAGHSLGEFTALCAAGALDFADALRLVHRRALAMQKACEMTEGTMAAVIGLEDEKVEAVCAAITDDIVVPANYNTPGQLVVSGSKTGIATAVEKLQQAGARKVMLLTVGGAFHSPLMQPAQDELAEAINKTEIRQPVCPVYQNVYALPVTDPAEIRQNLVKQLTAPVRWTQTIENMNLNGISVFVEVGGSGSLLRNMIKRILKDAVTEGI